MPKLNPVSWKQLVKRLTELGFEGPFSGGKHPQMRKGNLTLIISSLIIGNNYNRHLKFG